MKTHCGQVMGQVYKGETPISWICDRCGKKVPIISQSWRHSDKSEQKMLVRSILVLACFLCLLLGVAIGKAIGEFY